MLAVVGQLGNGDVLESIGHDLIRRNASETGFSLQDEPVSRDEWENQLDVIRDDEVATLEIRVRLAEAHEVDAATGRQSKVDRIVVPRGVDQ